MNARAQTKWGVSTIATTYTTAPGYLWLVALADEPRPPADTYEEHADE